MLRPALARSSVMLKEDRSPLEKIITWGAKALAAPEFESESELEPESESESEFEPGFALECGGALECGWELDPESDPDPESASDPEPDAEGVEVEGTSTASLSTIDRASTISLKSRPLGSVRSRRASSSSTVRHAPVRTS